MDERATYRILDANLNRAREALRVMEEFARFVLEDGRLAGRLKEARHELAESAGRLDSSRLLEARDTPGDVGRRLTTAAEGRRAGPQAVAVAAAKRLTEALRTVEEYAKSLTPSPATAFEDLRYRAYELERELRLPAGPVRQRRTRLLEEAQLHVLITSALCGEEGAVGVGRAVLAAGADVLQLREKGMADRELLLLACEMRRLCHEADKLFIVNDRADVAALSEADGVHVGAEDLPVAEARRIVGRDRIVGATAHSLQEARRACAEGADYLGVGAAFGSGTKPGAAVGGPELIAQVMEEASVPVVAIGGITRGRVGELLARGVRRIAVCGEVLSAEDPAAAVRALQEALGRTPHAAGGK